MKQSLKRILSLACAVVLVLALAAPAFAADSGSVSPVTGTQYTYLSSKNASDSSVYFTLASSNNKSFTIKRSDVKVGGGAKLVRFSKNVYSSTYTNESDWAGTGNWSSDTSSWKDYRYEAGIRVPKAGTYKITYKIGSKTYTINEKVLAYKNPIKSITLTGVNSGKSFASLTKSQDYASKPLTLKSTVKSAVLKLTPASGFKFRYVSIRDMSTDTERQISNYGKGLSSATIKWGTLNPDHSYRISASCFNTSNNATIYVSYTINSN